MKWPYYFSQFKTEVLIKLLVYILVGMFTSSVQCLCKHLFSDRFATLWSVVFPTFFWLQTARTFWDICMFPTFPWVVLGGGRLLQNLFKRRANLFRDFMSTGKATGLDRWYHVPCAAWIGRTQWNRFPNLLIEKSQITKIKCSKLSVTYKGLASWKAWISAVTREQRSGFCFWSPRTWMCRKEINAVPRGALRWSAALRWATTIFHVVSRYACALRVLLNLEQSVNI